VATLATSAASDASLLRLGAGASWVRMGSLRSMDDRSQVNADRAEKVHSGAR
jgi:hypothetical protein